MFKILWELQKHDTKTWSEQMLSEKWGTYRSAGHRVATNLQFVKNAIS